MSLDFIVVSDKAGSMETMFNALEQCLEFRGLRYKRVSTSEEALVTGQLDDRQPIPQNTVLYIHGNFSSGYQNVGLTADLAQERPDLRFIVQLDCYYHREEHFLNPDDFLFAKERLENQTINDQIIIVTEDFPEPVFFGRYARQPRIDSYITEIAPHIAAHHLPNPIRQQQGYHIYVVHDRPDQIHGLSDHLTELLDSKKVPYTIHILPETSLEEGADKNYHSFPEDALLIVHGNLKKGYKNAQHIQNLEERTANLRYVLCCARMSRESFEKEEDTQFIEGLLELGFDPARRINVVPINIVEFVYGKFSGNAHTEADNFETYFSAWQQQRNC